MVQLIGNLRGELAEDFFSKKIMKVINETAEKHPNMKKFYIIYSAKFDEYQPNIIREGFVVVDFNKGRPPEMLGAMCFLVNSSSREYSSVWNLPADHGSEYDGLLTGKGSSIVDQSAKNLVNNFKK